MVSLGKCIARTQNIEEAHKISKQYQLQGFTTKIIEKSESSLSLFEVWIFKKKEGLM